MTSSQQTDSHHLPWQSDLLPLPGPDEEGFRDWLMQYLGKPGENGAEGPDSFDCYGLVRNIEWHTTGVLLPEFPGVDRENISEVSRAIQGQADSGPWQRLETPVHGCVAALSKGRKFHHCGLFLDIGGGHILHLAADNTIHCEKISVVKRSYPRIIYYQYAKCRHSS